MVSIDTLKASVHTDFLPYFDLSKFPLQSTTTNKQNGDSFTTHRFNGKVGEGFNALTYNPANENVTIELSAKILLEDYFKNINLNTISQTMDCINSMQSAIQLSNDSIEALCVRGVDFTSNCKMEHEPLQYVKKMLLYSGSRSFVIDTYQRKHNTGFVLKRMGVGGKVTSRQVGYDKTMDLKKSANSDFLKAVRPKYVFDSFDNVLRVETNCRTTAKAKQVIKYMEGNKPKPGVLPLMYLLDSDENPNLNQLRKITTLNVGVQLGLFEMPGKLLQVEKEFGRRGIIQAMNFDMPLIKEFIKARMGKKSDCHSYFREYNKIRVQMLEEMNMDTTKAEPKRAELIQELEAKLLVA